MYGITYSNTAVPLIPAAINLEITEGWTAGNPHQDVLPKIWLRDNNQARIWFTEVASTQDLLQYMQSKFPTGPALASAINAANIATQATRFRAEQEILYDSVVKESILDQHVESLVGSAVQELASRGMSIELYPKLRDRLLHHLSIKLREALAQQPLQ